MILNTCLSLKWILAPEYIILMYLRRSPTAVLQLMLSFLFCSLCIPSAMDILFPKHVLSSLTPFLYSWILSLAFLSSTFIRPPQMLTVPRIFSWIPSQVCSLLFINYLIDELVPLLGHIYYMLFNIWWVFLCHSLSLPHLDYELSEGRGFCSSYRVALDVMDSP